jgi:hypothetical protein
MRAFEFLTESIDNFASKVQNELGIKSFYLSEKGDDITLHSIIVGKENQGKGLGSKAMKILTDYADQNNKRIILTPGSMDKNHGTTSRNRLVKFYKQFGFKESKGKNIDYALGVGKMFREPINSKAINESVDYFHGSKFADDDGNQWSVEKVLDFAKNHPKYFKKDFPLSKIKHDLSWWEDNPAQRKRMTTSDTNYPLLVIQNDDGHLTVADGLNRMKKAIGVEKRKTIDVYLVPKKDIIDLADKELEEMALPAEWDEAMLGHDKSFKKRLDYVLQRAPRLGGGSSRVAFIIPDNGRDTVLKVAKNYKGLWQNEAEVNVLTDGYVKNLDIVIPIIDFDKKNKKPTWVQTELAQKASQAKLCKIMKCGTSLNNLVGYAKYLLSKKSFYISRALSHMETLNDNDREIFREYAEQLADLASATDIELGDFNQSANWGIYNNKPVVIDVGFSEDVKAIYIGQLDPKRY